ncbi:DUF7426 family protein [Gordonia amicalis]|uniref:DUF7426 domain-containing protein n=1 Tax=Gordonia amicalis TaxID=89053 RepID=A0ABU4DJG6_9ACTN|nr:hypothetical protein [Gordonia amicalis]MDV6309905.1 hypothetical protein [Gordonia amicalis]
MGDTQLDDLDQFLSPTVDLPIGGNTYQVKPSAAQILKIIRTFERKGRETSLVDVWALGADLLGATLDPETDVITGAEGSVWSQMEADGVAGEQILRAAQSLVLRYQRGVHEAATFWQKGTLIDPKEVVRMAAEALKEAQAEAEKKTAEETPPNRATRRAAKKTPAKKASSKARTAGTTLAQEPTE